MHRDRPSPSRRSILFAALPTLALLVAACSSPGSSAGSAAGSSSPVSGSTVVKLSGFKFDPASLTITVGTKVTFQNMDGATHTVTNGKDGSPESNPLFDQSVPAGASFDFTFTTAGTFNVTCKIHHSMNMTITVQ